MQMKYYPYIQILVMTFFLIVAYLLFSYARRSEQNQVWAGMAKETAHQIGTPLSSLIGWIELLKLQETEFIGTAEMEKDIKRLETITERFSKIGSIPTLEDADIVEAVSETMNYLRHRFPTNSSLTYNCLNVPSSCHSTKPFSVGCWKILQKRHRCYD